MRKEVILAIIIGIILGGVVLYGLKIANQSASQFSQKPEASVTPPTVVTPIPTPIDSLTIETPIDHFVSFETNITLKGHTQPMTNIAFTSESNDDIVQSDAQGNFSIPVTLIGGENVLTVTALFSDNTSTSQSIVVIYTSSTIDN